LLRLTLDEARCIGLRRVLLTTEPANLGSINVILANGGVFSDTRVSPNTGRTLNRYRITL
jgi:predicted acetyltransferase